VDWKSGGPYWAVKSGLIYAFAQLDPDQGCDVALAGAGKTGAQIESRPLGFSTRRMGKAGVSSCSPLRAPGAAE